MKKLYKPSPEEDAKINQAIKADADSFEVSARQFTAARRGRPKLETPKTAISIRLDKEIVDHFKATGKGWQSRINEALKQAVTGRQ